MGVMFSISNNEVTEEYDSTIHTKCMMCRECIDLKVNFSDYKKWREGTLIQEAIPYLSSNQREILISGVCSTCYDMM